jgi:Ca-activated chloride channel homolog
MHFANPQMLWLLLLLGPLLAAFLVWAWHRKQTLIAQFVPQRLLPQLTDGISPVRQKIRLALVGLAALCTLLALARPQWGYEWHEVRQRGLDLVIAIDASRSMLAQDLPPDRLTRAKLAALDLAQLSRGDRFALVPFAGTAYLQCPLTSDFEAFRQNVDALSPDIMPQGGTSLAQAIRIARETLRDSIHNDTALVLITDGEDHDDGALAAAREAAQSGMRIFTVGIGTPEGTLLQHVDGSGALQYIKDFQGNVVLSRLNEPLLQQIAREANGFYVPLRAPDAIETLAQQGLARLARSESSTRMVRRFHEQFHWPLTLALVFLLIELFLSERKTAPRPAKNVTTRTNRTNARALTAVSTLLLVSGLAGSPARALKQFEAGSYDQAEAIYQQLLEQRGPDPRLHFNRGAAAYRRGDFTTAAREFAEATTSQDLTLQQRAYYNLGNALYRLGQQLEEDPQRKEPWNQAIQSYEASLQLQPDDPDADFNLQFVREQLEALPPPPPTSSPSPDSDDSDQDDSDPDSGTPQDSTDAPSREERSDSASPPPQPQPDQAPDTEPSPDTPPPDPEVPDQGDSTDDAIPEGSEQDSIPTSPTGPMTPEEVEQLLNAAQQEERPMIFAPPKTATPSRLKDW